MGREIYWKKEELNEYHKEQWARFVCGSVREEKGKSFKNIRFIKEQETLDHIWEYKKAREGIDKEIVKEVNNILLIGKVKKINNKPKRVLGGDLKLRLCRYNAEF